MGFKNTL